MESLWRCREGREQAGNGSGKEQHEILGARVERRLEGLGATDRSKSGPAFRAEKLVYIIGVGGGKLMVQLHPAASAILLSS